MVELDSMVTLPYHERRMQDGSAPQWRETMDRRHAALVEEVGAAVEAQLAAEVARAVDEERVRVEAESAQALAAANSEAARILSEEKTRAAEDSRRRLAESLNQTLRRIRQTAAEHETLQLVLEESAFCAGRAVVVLVESGRHARVAAWRNVPLRGDEEDSAALDLKEAAALASCVESGDPMAALASPGEISSVLAAVLGKGGEEKVYLFPVRVRQTTVALIVAGGPVTPAPLELLCEAAGMKLEALEAAPAASEPPAEKSGLVQIAAAGTGGEAAAKTWPALSPDEQALHLRAQRTARVRVAQIRISESAALRRGAQERDIYNALRDSIDAARGEYR
jgi:hypothetical protein